MDIQYTIDLHTYWHCSSGQGGGAEYDALVIKDKRGLPYIPGKTLKGLIRDAISEITGWLDTTGYENADIESLLGYVNDANDMKMADAYFSDAILQDREASTIINNSWQSQMYSAIASTQIDDQGIAVDNSLRRIEVCIPCTLHATISNVPDSLEQLLSDAMGYIKSLGSHRNRGLGRCTMAINK